MGEVVFIDQDKSILCKKRVYNDAISGLTITLLLWTCMNELLVLRRRASHSGIYQKHGLPTPTLLMLYIFLRNYIIKQHNI